MNIKNAQDKAYEARGDQEASQFRIDPRSCRGIGLSSQATRTQSLRFGRTNWKRRDFSDWPGGGNSGGILDQLIGETSEQLAFHTNQAETLRERLEGLKALAQQLEEKVQR